MSLKPHLACDIEIEKARFPLVAMPKIDGVRGINLDGNITGRRLKAFKNSFVGECFSHNALTGLDGELVLGEWTHPRLCSLTTGFVNRKTAREGKPTKSPDFKWYVFDYLHPAVADKPYIERLNDLYWAVDHWRLVGLNNSVILVPWKLVHSVEELLAFDEECLDLGFEGSIFRDPMGMHKNGRASVTTGAYMRLKRFIDFEGEVVEIIEAMENTNEAKVNELGRSERSTHKENMVPKGMLGMLRKRALADVLCPQTGRILIEKDQIVDVGPGNMPHSDRVDYFLNPDKLLAQIVKSKFFPKGQKDKPRFPTFVSLRAEEDMS